MKQKMSILLLALFAISLPFTRPLFAAKSTGSFQGSDQEPNQGPDQGPNVEEGLYIFDQEKKWLPLLKNHSALTIDHVGSEGFEVYGPAGLISYIQGLKDTIPHLILSVAEQDETQYKGLKRINDTLLEQYPTPEEIEQKLYKLATKYPHILKVFSIGKSVEGRPLLFVKISDNPNVDEQEPEFKYISSMHGDEITGRELMVSLIEDLAKAYDEGQDDIVNLINHTEIFIMPSMNPDGSARKRRGNARNVDLNRNFPDFTTSDNVNDPKNREIETQAIMRFQASRHFSLSANFHGGAEVVNYPWDTAPGKFPEYDFIYPVCLSYAAKVPGMYDSSEFAKGVTNGYAWYEVNGGMQDWSYQWYNDIQITIELSHRKWPYSYDDIPEYYKNNKESLIEFIGQIHSGFGLHIDPSLPSSGHIEISEMDDQGNLLKNLGRFAYADREFYHLLPPGRYALSLPESSQVVMGVVVTKPWIEKNTDAEDRDLQGTIQLSKSFQPAPFIKFPQ